MGLFDSCLDLVSDVAKAVVAPVEVVIDVADAIVKPIAEVAQDVVEEVKDLTK